MPQPERERVLRVKRGEVGDLTAVLAEIDQVQTSVREYLDAGGRLYRSNQTLPRSWRGTPRPTASSGVGASPALARTRLVSAVPRVGRWQAAVSSPPARPRPGRGPAVLLRAAVILRPATAADRAGMPREVRDRLRSRRTDRRWCSAPTRAGPCACRRGWSGPGLTVTLMPWSARTSLTVLASGAVQVPTHDVGQPV